MNLFTFIPLFIPGIIFPCPLIASLEYLPLREHNGYYYTWLSTPNYPKEFKTPHNRLYVIEARNLSIASPIINIYLTELYINSKFIRFVDGHSPPSNISVKTMFLSTMGERLDIHVNISDLYKNHFRPREHSFNHHHFGFNISIEVVDSALSHSTKSCSIMKCSSAGRCRSFPGERRLEFKCDCVEEYYGTDCEYRSASQCDPKNNINFCLNGGKCRSFGPMNIGRCNCPEGYKGSTCQLKPTENYFVSGNRDCTNASRDNDRPCSLCKKYGIPQDWSRYLIRLKNGNLSQENHKDLLYTIFDMNYTLRSQRTVFKTVILEVYGKLMGNKTHIEAANGISIIPDQLHDLSKNPFLVTPRISMNKENELPLPEGMEFSLTCKGRVKNASNSLIAVEWFKDHDSIQTLYTNRHISQFDSITESGSDIWSILVIDYTSPFDNGVFTCQVTDLISNVQQCVDYNMRVQIPPQIEVNPMSITVVKNESIVVTCTDSTTSLSPLNMTWYKDEIMIKFKKGDQYISEASFPQGQILRILNAQESGMLSCVARNDAGESKNLVRLEVLENKMNPHDSCNEEWENHTNFKMSWGLTSVGQTAMIRCPLGFFGYAQKRCRVGKRKWGEWDPTDFSRCTHAQLHAYNSTLLSMQNGFNVPRDGLAVLSIMLKNYLASRRDVPRERDWLLLGEGDKFISMLVQTFNYFNELKNSHPELVKPESVVGMIDVTQQFIHFTNSCIYATSVTNLVWQFTQFIQIQDATEYYNGSHILIQSPVLTQNDSRVEISYSNVQVEFDYWPMEEDEKEATKIIVTLMSSFPDLKEDKEENGLISNIISDIISVNISNKYYFKSKTFFRITFYEIETEESQAPKNLSCASLVSSTSWEKNSSCKINYTKTVVDCYCNRLGIYAIIALKEHEEAKPVAAEHSLSSPTWITISGCTICLVFSLKALIMAVVKKVAVTCKYFIILTAGTALNSILLILLIVQNGNGGGWIAILFYTLTMVIISVRLLKLTQNFNLTDLYPWLSKVSDGTMLSAIFLTLTLPIWTAFLCDFILYGNDDLILYRASPVFMTFASLIILSVLLVIFVHCRASLSVQRRMSHNYNNNKTREKTLLTENLLGTSVHWVQIVCVMCFFNRRQSLPFHYAFAVSTAVLGMVCRTPPSGSRAEDGGNIVMKNSIIRQVEEERMTTTSSNSILGKNSAAFELQTMRGLTRTCPSLDEEEDDDHATIETSVSTVSNVYNNGGSHLTFPLKGTCLITYDELDYVPPSISKRS